MQVVTHLRIKDSCCTAFIICNGLISTKVKQGLRIAVNPVFYYKIRTFYLRLLNHSY